MKGPRQRLAPQEDCLVKPELSPSHDGGSRFGAWGLGGFWGAWGKVEGGFLVFGFSG